MGFIPDSFPDFLKGFTMAQGFHIRQTLQEMTLAEMIGGEQLLACRAQFCQCGALTAQCCFPRLALRFRFRGTDTAAFLR